MTSILKSQFPAVALIATVSLAFAVTVSASGQDPSASSSGKLVSYSVTPSAGSRSTLIKVPARGQLLVKQLCTDSPAVQVTLGDSNTRLSYFRQYSCTSFRPGYVVRGGQELRCVNKSGTARSCSVTGTLIRRKPAPERRVIFLEP